MMIPDIYHRNRYPIEHAYNAEWKKVNVGDRAWVTYYDSLYFGDVQHLCTVTFVGDKGIMVRDDGKNDPMATPIFWRDIVGLEIIKEA